LPVFSKDLNYCFLISSFLVKMPRKMKTAALGIGVASLLLGASPAWAEKAEYTYDNTHTAGDPYYDPADSGNGSQASPANPGHYIDLVATNGEWFAYFVGDGVNGIWQAAADAGNRLIVDYPGSINKPAFVLGGVAGFSADDVAGNEVHYSGGASASADILIGGFSQNGSARGNTVYYYGGAIVGGLILGNGSAGGNYVTI
jgi:hypothetical protein